MSAPLRLFRSFSSSLFSSIPRSSSSFVGSFSRPRFSSSLYSHFVRSMFIQTQSTPNPNSMKFLPGKPVLSSLSSTSSGSAPPSALDFPTFKSAQRSPLAQSLFKIEGVTGVFLGADFISVNISDGQDWTVLKPQVFAAIMEFYTSKQPILMESEDAEQENPNAIQDGDSEIVSMIKELIETRIRPAVQEDGGDIAFRGFDEATGIVKVQMQGSCVGCSSSQITLKNGIENMLMHYVPEVKRVEEVKGELDQVSEQELKKLEEKLANVQKN